MKQDEKTDLLDRYLAGRTTPQEDEVVEKWLAEMQPLNSEWEDKSDIEKKKYIGRLFEEISQSKEPLSKVVKIRRRAWMAAAAVFFALVIGAWFFIQNRSEQDGHQLVSANTEFIVPGGNKAVLTLADGSTIVLDSANTGTLTTQGNAMVMKMDDGELSYQLSGGRSKTDQIQFNTITTPRGGVYQLVLSDGTRVWLNSESSLRYPAVFGRGERRVELTGEGYFEVARNESKPFRVQSGDVEVKVLGTYFNVNTYPDEPTKDVTLLEGSVEVQTGSNKVRLKPTEQAQANNTGNVTIKKGVNLEEVVAWKDGRFLFNQATIVAVMHQVSRWYDVDYEIRGEVNQHFQGMISRDVPLSRIVELLSLTGSVKVEVEGRKLIIYSKN